MSSFFPCLLPSPLSEVESNIFTVYAPCPRNCSGNGVCSRGNCTCDKKWKGDDCSVGSGIIELSITRGVPVDMTANKIGFEVMNPHSRSRPFFIFNPLFLLFSHVSTSSLAHYQRILVFSSSTYVIISGSLQATSQDLPDRGFHCLV